jgi:hypothetical protein
MSPLDQAKAEVARLELEAKTIPFTKDDKFRLGMLGNLLGYDPNDPDAGWSYGSLKVIKRLDERLRAIETALEANASPTTLSWNDIIDRPTDLSMIDPARAAKIDATNNSQKLQRRGLDGYETKGGGQ